MMVVKRNGGSPVSSEEGESDASTVKGTTTSGGLERGDLPGPSTAGASSSSRPKRCDGKHPTCSSCLRAKRECIYEEEKSRTQKLMDRIDELQGKLSELEASSSQMEGPSRQSGSQAQHMVTIAPPVVPWVVNWDDVIRLGGMTASGIDLNGEWWSADHPPPVIQKYLLDVCISQRTRPALNIHVGRFRERLTNGPRPIDALLNAMYLVGCHLSNDPRLVPYEQHYLARSRKLLQDTLSNDPKLCLVQWMQASCLVTYYLTRVGRFLEARHELSGAVQLIVACDLHKIKSSVWHPCDQTDLPPTEFSEMSIGIVNTPVLLPPSDNLDLGERIGLFWMAYTLDHVSSLVCGLPPNPYFETCTETVWPRPFEEYEYGIQPTPDTSVASLFGPNPASPFDPPCCMYALRVKSIALLAREYRHALTVFLEGLPPVTYDPSTNEIAIDPQPPINMSLFLIHTTTLIAFVHLYGAPLVGLTREESTSGDTPTSSARQSPASVESDHVPGGQGNYAYDKRLAMVKRIVMLVRALASADIAVRALPTLCGFAWAAAARVTAQHYRKLSAMNIRPAEIEETRRDLDTLLGAIAGMAEQVPILGYQLDRLRAYATEEDGQSPIPCFGFGTSPSIDCN
ncbi:hypothetical protein FRB99_006564 [Tulasnella sp. 403]|nr:hypothetical protein FRB99_006564 [Tulasnella sp. 403]